MNMQISYISPPFGPAAFYLKGVTPPGITLGDIFRSIWPYLGLQVIALGLVIAFPQIALWLPSTMDEVAARASAGSTTLVDVMRVPATGDAGVAVLQVARHERRTRDRLRRPGRRRRHRAASPRRWRRRAAAAAPA